MFFTTKTKEEKTTQQTSVLGSIFDTVAPAKEEEATCGSAFDATSQKIRELAYKKWEDAGAPWGRDDEFWGEAERELTEKD